MLRHLPPLLALLAAALLPALGASPYVLGIGITACIFTVGAASLNLIYGYAGLLSFAHLAFWGIGGYCTALGAVSLGIGFWGGLALAGLLNAALAVLVGIPALRLNRHSFVIVTLSFSLLTALVARDWVAVTGGPLGIPGLPAPELFGLSLRSPPRFYWLALAFAALSLALLRAVTTSRIGRTLKALRQNEPLAQAQGIAPTPYKLLAFAISAALCGMAGGMQVFYMQVVDPLILDFYYFQTFLVMMIVGGAGHFWAVVIAGIVMTVLPELLRATAELRMVIYGALLLFAMVAMPGGVAGALESWRDARRRATAERPDPVTAAAS
ncbi:branched-chain amino acid ABC transporter permease [Roseomonas sp. NAR14]|uniref:Branched-chain amino acid ABC transporter permease n=1 Tax=Roseomonas acroporae TaxID=2937791 RepID=A0A9X2BX82_9PROT|nr:branched-chain amino acid ABC transporter permease [Roseomonas acroporae]MCK8785684.1 branched-chain amino acid ABC transporter permease [Roseomonas acroporae]